MAKQKYFTEYPAILKEKAKHTGVKIKKEDYKRKKYSKYDSSWNKSF